MTNSRLVPQHRLMGRLGRAMQPLLLLLLSVGLVACGGPSTPATVPDVEPSPEDSTEMVGEPLTGPAHGGAPNLPTIPEAAAAVPATLMAEAVFAKPNAQFTELGLFVDAVQPGMGAFITPQAVLQQLSGIIGAPLAGLDLNGPLYVLVLDGEQMLLVATVASEAELNESLEDSGTYAIAHNGLAAIGKEEALKQAAPYALSNLVKAEAPALPSLILHVGKMMKGPKGAEIRQGIMEEAGSAGAIVAGSLVEALNHIDIIRTGIEAKPSALTIHMSAEVAGGPLKTFLSKQRPSDFSMMERVGTGPWGITAGGRIDLSVLAPLLVSLGESQANPVLTQISAQLSSLAGEMAVGLNLPKKPEFVMAMALSDSKGVAQVVDTLMALASKQKDQKVDGMDTKLKLASIKTRAGVLHEMKLKPSSTGQIEMYGKRGVSGFFGVAVDSLIATFGVDAKKHAKTLSTAKGKLKGNGSKLAAAIALAKSSQESLLIAMDVLSLKGDREPKDVTPIVMGVGFSASEIRGRMVVPTDFVKEAAGMF